MNDLAEYFSNPFAVRGLIGILLIAINAALAGSFAAFRGSTFLVSGAAHAALGGAAPVANPFGLMLGLHVNCNSIGSGTVFEK